MRRFSRFSLLLFSQARMKFKGRALMKVSRRDYTSPPKPPNPSPHLDMAKNITLLLTAIGIVHLETHFKLSDINNLEERMLSLINKNDFHLYESNILTRESRMTVYHSDIEKVAKARTQLNDHLSIQSGVYKEILYRARVHSKSLVAWIPYNDITRRVIELETRIVVQQLLLCVAKKLNLALALHKSRNYKKAYNKFIEVDKLINSLEELKKIHKTDRKNLTENDIELYKIFLKEISKNNYLVEIDEGSNIKIKSQIKNIVEFLNSDKIRLLKLNLYNSIAMVCRPIQRIATSIEYYEKALEIEKEDSIINSNKGALLNYLGRKIIYSINTKVYDGSLLESLPSLISKFLKEEVTKSYLENNFDTKLLKNLLKEVSKKAEACHVLAIRLKTGQEDAAAYNRYGYFLHILGDPSNDSNAKALIYYDRALQHKRNNPTILENKAAVLIDLGQWNEAIVILENVLENNPNRSDCYYHIAKAYFKNNKYEKCLENIERYRVNESYYPDFDADYNSEVELLKKEVEEALSLQEEENTHSYCPIM